MKKGTTYVVDQCIIDCKLIIPFPTAAADCHNEMLSHYHPEPYTGGKWNCCKQESRHCQGCLPKDATHGV